MDGRPNRRSKVAFSNSLVYCGGRLSFQVQSDFHNLESISLTPSPILFCNKRSYKFSCVLIS